LSLQYENLPDLRHDYIKYSHFPSGVLMFTHNGLVETLVNAQPDPQAIGLVPMVVEQSGRGERAFDI
jgi:hypothetical protein